jgi:hypothetical protein
MNPGKFLELLVECLQRVLAPDNFSVTRNKKYYLNRQQIGEVDILVQGRLGSENVKIAIECRDRKGLQGCPWIREIIGKKMDLRKFGITHWMAVSVNGFTDMAEKLAKEFGIIVIVPHIVTPIEPEKPGPHDWMKWGLVEHNWENLKWEAVIDHQSDETLDYLEETIKDHLEDVLVKRSNEAAVPIFDVIGKEIEFYFDKNFSEGQEPLHNCVISLEDLYGTLNGVDFLIKHLEVNVSIRSRTIVPDFQMMGFFIPSNNQVLAIIGINEYETQGRLKYLMVGIRQGIMNSPIMVLRDIDGKPLPNTRIRFTVPSIPPGTPFQTLHIRGR